jgi:hypothetical protein
MKLDINKVSTFEKKKVAKQCTTCILAIFVSQLMLFTCDIANNIKCFRVDVTLAPGM